MLEDAKNAGCIGRSSEWLQTRYGHPHRIHQDETDPGTEHWWYTPDPWFIVHEDYVGFIVQKGVVADAYMQVN